MGELEVELIVFGILTRLPARDVAKCKIVCTEWLALLSTHGFEKAHSTRSSNATCQKTLLSRGLSCSVFTMDFETGDCSDETRIPFPFQPGLKGITILGHLDGLLCVCLQPSHELVLWNPTTRAYKHLTTTEDKYPFNYAEDTVGLYNGQFNDFNVLHVIRSPGVVSAKEYSRRLGTWRQIGFQSKPEYAKRMFVWSVGTLCSKTLYFTVSEYWNVFVNVVVAFDTITEEVTELSFPPVPQKCIYEGFLANVQNHLHMVLVTTTDHKYQKMIGVWSLEGDTWSSNFSSPPLPPITCSTWFNITHYITNGRWIVMGGSRKLYELPKVGKALECFHAADKFRCDQGAVFTETVVSPKFYI